MSIVRISDCPSAGEPITGNEQPVIELRTATERKVWRWLLDNIDRRFCGSVDLMALTLAAQGIGQALDAHPPMPIDNFIEALEHLVAFGLTPDGRRRLIMDLEET